MNQVSKKEILTLMYNTLIKIPVYIFEFHQREHMTDYYEHNQEETRHMPTSQPDLNHRTDSDFHLPESMKEIEKEFFFLKCNHILFSYFPWY